MSDREDPDETAHYEPSHLDLRCLPKPIIIACRSERVKDAGGLRDVAFSVILYEQTELTKSVIICF